VFSIVRGARISGVVKRAWLAVFSYSGGVGDLSATRSVRILRVF
jgi:hypothetical protein